MNDRISLGNAWAAFWTHPKKWEFILIWLGLYAGIFAISFLLNLLSVIPIIGVILMCVTIPFMLVLEFAATFFILGYTLEIADSTRLGKTEFPKILSNLKERLLFGGKAFLLSFIYNLPTVVIFIGLYISFFVGIAMLTGIRLSDDPAALNNGSLLVSLLALLIVVVLLFVVIAVAILNRFLVDSAIYKLLVSKRDLAMGFKFNSVFEIFKKGFKHNLSLLWNKFLMGLIFGVITLVLISPAIILFVFTTGMDNDASAVLGISAFCFYILAIVILSVLAIPVSYYVYPHLIGQMYAIWDKKDLDKV